MVRSRGASRVGIFARAFRGSCSVLHRLEIRLVTTASLRLSNFDTFRISNSTNSRIPIPRLSPSRYSTPTKVSVLTFSQMKHLAAYLLLQQGGNASPSAADVKALLEVVGIEADAAQLDKLIAELEGKDVNEVS